MDVSDIYAVEYHPGQQKWRVITLDKVLQANYNVFLNSLQGHPARPILGEGQPDWILLGIGSSKEEAEGLIEKLDQIKDTFVHDLHAARGSDTARGEDTPG